VRIYFFPHFPAGFLHELLRDTDEQCRAFPCDILPHYSKPWQLVFKWWPRLLGYGFRIARLSLWGENRPEAVVAYTHLTLVPVILLRWLMRRRGPRLLFYGFIYTERRSRLLRWLRSVYFRWLVSRLDLIVCHSNLETQAYPRLFGVAPRRFVFLRYSLDINGAATSATTGDFVATAGRSGRDYELLVEAVRGLSVPVKIICDRFPFPGTSCRHTWKCCHGATRPIIRGFCRRPGWSSSRCATRRSPPAKWSC